MVHGIHLNNIRAMREKISGEPGNWARRQAEKREKIVGGGEKVEKKEGIREKERERKGKERQRRGRKEGRKEEERKKERKEERKEERGRKEEGGGTKSMACFSGPWLLEVMGV